MDIEVYMTAEKLLYTRAVKCLQEAHGSVTEATSLLAPIVADNDELLDEICAHYLQTVLDRDMNGGGIGLRPVDKTGSNAVADETGQLTRAAHVLDAPSSVPQSQTPAEKPVVGGHGILDSHDKYASHTSSGNAHYTTVKQHPRRLPSAPPPVAGVWSPSNIAPSTKTEMKPKVPYVAPKERVSAQAQLRTKNIVAASFLKSTIVRGKPLGDWRKGEALALTERMKWDCKVLDELCTPMPSEEMAIKDFYTEREAEEIYRRLEANRAA